MRKNHNVRLLKSRHSYSFMEIAQILKVHPRTVQGWHRQGLQVVDETSKPFLVLGAEMRRFLQEIRQSRRHSLGKGEFYCPKCREPRKSLPDKLFAQITERKLGKASKQAFLKGICEVCGKRLILFSSDKKIEELKASGVLLRI